MQHCYLDKGTEVNEDKMVSVTLFFLKFNSKISLWRKSEDFAVCLDTDKLVPSDFQIVS